MRSGHLLAGTLTVALLLMAAGVAVMRAWEYRPKPGMAVDTAKVTTMATPPESTGTLRVAVSSMISPADTIRVYKRLVDYLGAEVGVSADLVVRKTYQEVNELIADGSVDVAFVCAGAYAVDRHKGYMRLLAAPVVRGQTTYYSDIIVPAGSADGSLADLAGKRFAFVDEISNTGRMAPRRLLESRGLDPDRFFAETVVTGSHDKSIAAVERALVDGAAVDHLVLEAMRKSGGTDAPRVRVVERIGPYGMPPVVVRRSLDPGIRRSLLRALLGAGADAHMLATLREAGIDSFRVPDESEYDSVLDAAPQSRLIIDDK